MAPFPFTRRLSSTFPLVPAFLAILVRCGTVPSRSCLRSATFPFLFLVPLGAILSAPRDSWRDPLRPLGAILSAPRASQCNPCRSSCLLAQSSPFLVHLAHSSRLLPRFSSFFVTLGAILSVPRVSCRDLLCFWTTPRGAMGYFIFAAALQVSAWALLVVVVVGC